MPSLNEIIKDRESKKFIKKAYRPWDLTGENNGPVVKQDLSIISSEQQDTNILIENNNSNIKPIVSENIDNKLDIKKVSNGEQPDNNKISLRNQLDNHIDNNQITNREHIDINLDPTTLMHQLVKLSGIQKIIFNLIIDICSSKNTLETGPIETLSLASLAKTTTGVIKISIKRLIDKNFIIRNKGKQSKGGYINLAVTDEIYKAAILLKENYNRGIFGNDFLSLNRYQIDIEPHYSSNSLNKNITTKKTDILPEEWLEIDFEALVHIGFSKTQLKQLVDKNEPGLVQESINHFAFGLEHNNKVQKYDEPLNVLMGVLRKGQAWYEKDYRSPKEIAQQHLLEHKRAESERKKIFEEDAYKLALSEWQENLSKEEIEKIAPDRKLTGNIMPQAAQISLYFKENLWPKIKTDYLI